MKHLTPEAKAAYDHLSASDVVMSGLLEGREPLVLSPSDDYFFTLVDAICSQQLSSKVAATLVSRIRALVPGKETPDAGDIAALSDEALRSIGLSWRKVSYVKDLAGHVLSGALPLDHISRLDDEEVIRDLVAAKGIGRWTAEMFLIFSLGRTDVLAVDDYGLRSAIMRLYGLPDLPKPTPMREIGEPWRPYRSYASLYLWRSHDNPAKIQALEAEAS